MRTIQEIRFHNFDLLLKEAGDGRGAAARLAELTGVAPGLISQIKDRKPRSPGVPLKIGDKTARKLESGTGRTQGWMDMDHSDAETAEEADVLDLFRGLDVDLQAQLVQHARHLAELARLRRPDSTEGT